MALASATVTDTLFNWYNNTQDSLLFRTFSLEYLSGFSLHLAKSAFFTLLYMDLFCKSPGLLPWKTENTFL